jgi:uncharacterized protein (TIGR03067 family)
VRKVMHLTRLRWAMAFALAVVVIGAGVTAGVSRALAAADDDPKVKAELKKFQGTWVVIYAEKAGEELEQVGDHQLKFDGETFSHAVHGHVDEKGTFKLDPSKNPKEIDIRLRDRDSDEKTVLGIYTWDGENLNLCLGKPGGGTRPKDFTTMPEGRDLVVVKRQDPAQAILAQGQAVDALPDDRQSAKEHADATSLTARTDRLFAAWDKPGSPGGALAVVQDGKVVYRRGYGTANLEYGIPITPATIFEVASVSKQFTAFTVQLLAQEHRLSLDDDVRKYLPELHDFGKTITIRHLLHHTSGLRDQSNLLRLAGWRSEDVITEQDVFNLVWRQEELNFEPGAEYLYSNTGYTLLGLIVKRISGRSLNVFCQERMFQPLGMKNTHFPKVCSVKLIGSW